jgi:serine/threonine-protein kinase
MEPDLRLVAQFIRQQKFAEEAQVAECLEAVEKCEYPPDLVDVLLQRGYIDAQQAEIVRRVFPPPAPETPVTSSRGAGEEGGGPGIPVDDREERFSKVVRAYGTLPADLISEARTELLDRRTRGETTTLARILCNRGYMTPQQVEQMEKKMKVPQFRCEGCDRPYDIRAASGKCPSCSLSLPRAGEVIPLEVGNPAPPVGTLAIVLGTNQGMIYGIAPRTRVNLGRNKRNKIRIYGKNVSRNHAEIISQDGQTMLRDRNSRFGTYHNGQRIREIPLADGDLIKIGTTILEYRQRAPGPGARLFGEVAQVLGFASSDAVTKALALQKDRKKGSKIGQILLELGELNEIEIAQVLQAQRQKLAAPLPRQGVPQMGRPFGSIAVTEGYIDTEQLEQALRDQVSDPKDPKRRIGEILVDRRAISSGAVDEILKRQRGDESPPDIKGYRLEKKIGEGGMGTVYRAMQVSLDRSVAIKILSPSLARDKTFIKRFVTEARSAGRLNHPNIIRAIDVGESGGHYYFAMEFVDGETLYAVLKKLGHFNEDETIEIGNQILRALGHADQHNIVHRDIKPDNIMLDQGGLAKLCDLGLAKNVDTRVGETRADEAVGTPNYVSPEQAKGVKDIDIRADIYSLGATMYHMATGQMPFKRGGTPIVIMAKHITDQIPNPRKVRPELSRDFSRILEMMMVKDRDKRYQKPLEALDDLRAVQRGDPPKLPRIITAKSTISKEV